MKNCAEKFIYPSLRGLEQAVAISRFLILITIMEIVAVAALLHNDGISIFATIKNYF